MTPKPLSREELDDLREGSPWSQYRLLATIDAAREDEARALNLLRDEWLMTGDALSAIRIARFIGAPGVLR